MSSVLPLLLAGVGGGVLALALRETIRSSPAVADYVESALRALALAGTDGRPPSERERQRLGLLAGGAISMLTVLLFGLGPAALFAALGPTLASRLLGRRRRSYRRRFEREVPALASGLADALAAGASLRNGLLELGRTLEGPARAELIRVRADLELGLSPGAALGAMAGRLDSEPAEALVAAILSRQRSGGDLADLLRRHGAAAAARQRALASARSATAQARLTGGMVAVMPIAAALLVELVSPGFVASMAGDPVAAVLLLVALALQLAGYLVIQRLGRVSR